MQQAARSATMMAMDVPRCQLSPTLSISRIVTGLWQVADLEREGGLGLEERAALAALSQHLEGGLTSFDMADHYGSAEELVGALLASRAVQGGSRTRRGFDGMQTFTKWCPKPGPAQVTAAAVDAAVQLSCSRMQLPVIPLLQLHTWDYLDGPGAWLEQLRLLQVHPAVGNLGLTNVDAAHLRLALAEGIDIVSNQVSFSLLDSRALRGRGGMCTLCETSGVKILAFGVLAGGFLSDRWLGQPPPSAIELAASWSLAKYRRFIDGFGGWEVYQELLSTLRVIADGHVLDDEPVSIANVATRWVLEQPAVGAAIVPAAAPAPASAPTS